MKILVVILLRLSYLIMVKHMLCFVCEGGVLRE